MRHIMKMKRCGSVDQMEAQAFLYSKLLDIAKTPLAMSVVRCHDCTTTVKKREKPG